LLKIQVSIFGFAAGSCGCKGVDLKVVLPYHLKRYWSKGNRSLNERKKRIQELIRHGGLAVRELYQTPGFKMQRFMQSTHISDIHTIND
jgi:hypothetical protein